MKMNRNSIPARGLMDGMVSRIVAMIFLSCGHDLASLRSKEPEGAEDGEVAAAVRDCQLDDADNHHHPVKDAEPVRDVGPPPQPDQLHHHLQRKVRGDEVVDPLVSVNLTLAHPVKLAAINTVFSMIRNIVTFPTVADIASTRHVR